MVNFFGDPYKIDDASERFLGLNCFQAPNHSVDHLFEMGFLGKKYQEKSIDKIMTNLGSQTNIRSNIRIIHLRNKYQTWANS